MAFLGWVGQSRGAGQHPGAQLQNFTPTAPWSWSEKQLHRACLSCPQEPPRRSRMERAGLGPFPLGGRAPHCAALGGESAQGPLPLSGALTMAAGGLSLGAPLLLVLIGRHPQSPLGEGRRGLPWGLWCVAGSLLAGRSSPPPPCSQGRRGGQCLAAMNWLSNEMGASSSLPQRPLSSLEFRQCRPLHLGWARTDQPPSGSSGSWPQGAQDSLVLVCAPPPRGCQGRVG